MDKTRTARHDAIKAELEKIRRRHGGRLTAEAVVQAARREGSVLHKCFEWRDAKAAHKHRVDVARDLIATYVTITVIHRAQTITCPMYVRDPNARPHEQGYTAVTSESLDRAAGQSIVLAELDRCQNAVERARNIAGVLDVKFAGLSDQLESLLAGIIDTRRMMAA